MKTKATPADLQSFMEITVKISSDTLVNMVVSAIESGDPVTTAARGGWCSGINTTDKLAKKFAFTPDESLRKVIYPWYANPKFYEFAGLVIGVTEVDDETTGHETVHKITRSKIIEGLRVMAEKFPRQFAMVLENETDAPCADIFLQCVVFGEDKYC